MVNVFLAGFNLLPAFPMDGGRVLRALLATKIHYMQATRLAAGLGQRLAFLFGLLGLFINPFLLIIAIFVWIGATQEASMVQNKSALDGIPVGRAMLTDFRTLSPHDSLERVIELTLSGWQQEFPVVENGHVVGILCRSDLLAALAKRGQESPVTQIMKLQFQTVDSFEMLEAALARLKSSKSPMLPVMNSGQLVGLITLDNVGKFLTVQAAIKKKITPSLKS